MTTGIGSTGTLPNGQAYGQALADVNGDEIVLGGGALYFVPIDNLTSIPDDDTIEVPSNNVGWCDGGFKINYKPKATKVYNQYDQLVRTFITREDFTVKTGILSWNVKNLTNLSNAQYIKTNTDVRSVFTGSGALKIFLIRFVHTKKSDGEKIRFTMVGQGGNGFDLAFGDKATTIDAELNAIQYFENFLAEIRESLTQTESNSASSN